MKTATASGRAVAKSERARRRPVARANGKPLSNAQKSAISQTARQAFEVQDRAGLVDESGSESARFTAWRHGQQTEAVGVGSLRDCGNDHYRPLMAHFLCLAGKDDTAFRYQLRTGRVKDHGALEDTHENRETQRALILAALLEHGHRCNEARAEYDAALAKTVADKGGGITAGYVVSLAKMKCKGRALDSLTAAELAQILWTVRNRISAREGKGKTGTRNKSQRKKGASQA
jgi:hypothetical protein